MRLGLTGTPGTGKTAVAEELRRRGVPVVDLAQLADDCGAIEGVDEVRQSRIVDEVILADAWETAAAVLEGLVPLVACEGHYAHDVPVDLVVVLRCEPRALVARLAARGWPEAKVRENVEAEAMGIVAYEAMHGTAPACDVDTTNAPIATVAEAILAAAAGGARARVDPGRWDVADLPWL